MFTARVRLWLAAATALIAVPGASAVMLIGRAAAAPPQVACAADKPDAASAFATARACGSRVEVLAARSEYTQGFANPDGTSTLVSTAVPARVHRVDGSWAAVDTSLQARPDGSLAPVAAVSN